MQILRQYLPSEVRWLLLRMDWERRQKKVQWACQGSFLPCSTNKLLPDSMEHFLAQWTVLGWEAAQQKLNASSLKRYFDQRLVVIFVLAVMPQP